MPVFRLRESSPNARTDDPKQQGLKLQHVGTFLNCGSWPEPIIQNNKD